MKTCTRCGTGKPKTEFYAQRRGQDGLAAWCKECYRENCREWHRKNPERSKANTMRHRTKADFRESERVRARERYAANPEPAKRNARAWRLANPDKALEMSRAKRARKASAAGSASREQIAARVEFYGGKCWMCGMPWEHIDHVIPLSRGGTNWPANLRPACARGKPEDFTNGD